MDNLSALGFEDYEGQVLDYLEPEHLERFGTAKVWSQIVETVGHALDGTGR